VLNLACLIIVKVSLLLDLQASSKKRLDADVRGQIYAFVASSGKQSDYNTIQNIYLSVIPLFLTPPRHRDKYGIVARRGGGPSKSAPV